jgi:hypothetical protein
MEEFRCCKTISKGLNFATNTSLTMGSKLLGYEECKILFWDSLLWKNINFFESNFIKLDLPRMELTCD